MSKNEQFEGEYNNSQKKPQGLGKVFLIGLCAGVLGGGVAVGGYALYQNNGTQLASNAQGTTATSNLKVNVSTQTTKAFDAVKDAVVSVEAYSETQSNSSLDDLFGQTPGNATTQTSTSEGSGVIYKKSGNTAYIVTNNHVISGANKVEVLLNSGKKLAATVVGHDAVTDLAVLKIDAKDVKQVASFGNSNDIKVGETALAIGSPLGSEYATSLTQGIISAKSRTINVTNSSGVTTGQATVIQTDAAINPGNSGGALVNLAGQVIGINSMKLSGTGSSDSATVEGMGFAIPSNEVVEIINQLVENGKVKRPALGISLVDLDYISQSARTETLKLPNDVTSGVVVMKIEADSPLKDSGVAKYDVITSIAGKKVTDLASLRQALYAHKIGETVEIGYYHEGKQQTAKVKLTLEANDSNTTTSSNSQE